MRPETFLLLNVALAFYNVGTIWAHEVDIFRTWKLLDPATFLRVQTAHWKKLPFWVFAPVGLSLLGTVALLWYRPAGIPAGWIWLVIGVELLSHVLTAMLWGPWQAKLSKDARGGESPYLQSILRTHWLRTALITCYALSLLIIAIGSYPHP